LSKSFDEEQLTLLTRHLTGADLAYGKGGLSGSVICFITTKHQAKPIVQFCVLYKMLGFNELVLCLR